MKTNYLLAAILCCLTPLLHAQTALSGKVVSADTNEPLAGVNIRVDNSLTGCTTNGKGEFIIDNLPDGQHTTIPLSGVWVERIWITVIRTSH